MSRIHRVAALFISAALFSLQAQSTNGAATVSVTSSANPAVYAAPLTFTVAVAPPVAGSPVPTGVVSATLAGSHSLDSATLDAAGRAAIAVPQAPGTGSNTITFSYSGDTRYAPAQSTFTQFLKRANTHTDAVLNGNLPLTATVRIDESSANVEPSASAGSAPSGTVQFFDGTTLLGTATLAPSSLLTSIATLPASTTPATLTAVYSGDANFNVSRSASAVRTGTGSVTLSVTSSANPSVFAEPVTLQIAVAPAAVGAPVPTGSVMASVLGLFVLGGVWLDATGQGALTVPLSSTSAIPYGFAAGSNSVSLTYSGDPNYASAQTTFTQSVSKADTGANISVFDASSLAPGGLAAHATVFNNDPSAVPIGFAIPGAGAGSANPTGSVQFVQGTASIGTATLSPTAHLESTAYLLANATIYEPVVATYSGDANYNASTVTSSNQSPPAPTVTVTSSANPTSFAQPVTFSVTVASAVAGGAIPTGTIVATVFGSETLGYATLDNYGKASFTVPQTLIASVCANCSATSSVLPWGLATGSNDITVTYSGDFSYAQAQTTFNEVVTKLDTVTSVLVAPTATSGKSFDIVATVGFHALQILTTPFAIPSTGSVSPSPTGNVAFFDGTTLIGTVPLIQEINFTSTATLTTSTLPGSVSAVYYGDTNFNGSSSASTTLSGGAPVNMRVTAGGGSLVYGEAFPIVATLTPAIDTAPTPTGTLTFYDGTQNLGWTATLDAAGTGTLLIPMPLGTPAGCAPACPAAAQVLVLSPGTHSITVKYSGDANYAGATSSALTFAVTKAPTVTTVSGACTGLLPGACAVAASVADSQPPAGGPVHFMTMGPSGLVDGDPSGTVQFFNGSTSAGTASLTPSTTLTVTSTASLTTTVGASSAVYSGDANFQGSTSSSSTPPPASPLASGVSLSSSANPSTAGQSVTLTANVFPSSLGLNAAFPAPTGTVTFLDGTTSLGQVTLTAGITTGTATLATTFTTAGPHFLSANYSGDSNYLASSSAGYAQIVNPQSGTLGGLSLTASVPAASYGQQMVFFAGVTGSGNAPPQGVVTLLDGTAVVGGAQFDLGTAPIIVILPVGTHQLSAAWAGDGNYPPAVSPVLTYVVTRAPTSTTLGSPSTNATSLVLVATVTPYPAGAGTPSGTVQFLDATTQAVLATSTLNAGSATATLPASDASLPIVAVYSGDANFAANTTAPPALAMVDPAANVIESVAAPGEIVTLYGANLATSTASATPPLPTSLAGATVTVTDVAGVSRSAALYYASPGQINFVVPTGSASGPATLSVAGQSLSFSVTPVSPSLFPVGQFVAVHPDGTQSVESTEAPIAFGSDTLYLVLYATGIRNRSSLGNVTCTIGNNYTLPVTYAGAQSQFPGLDQVVVPLPASLDGVGTVRMVVTADGHGSNSLSLAFVN